MALRQKLVYSNIQIIREVMIDSLGVGNISVAHINTEVDRRQFQITENHKRSSSQIKYNNSRSYKSIHGTKIDGARL